MTYSQIKSLVDEEVGRRPEAFVDFLETLALAARATGAHLREDWQEPASGLVWERLGNKAENLAAEADRRLKQLFE